MTSDLTFRDVTGVRVSLESHEVDRGVSQTQFLNYIKIFKTRTLTPCDAGRGRL